MGVLELHLWGSRVDTLEKPDRIVFDFDPDEGLDFATVADAAKEMRERLKTLGLEIVPDGDRRQGHPRRRAAGSRSTAGTSTANFAEAMARMMAEENPDRYVAKMSKAKRRGRIFIDYLRNGRGSTAIAPYSTRARAGAPVAWPVSWAALARLKDAHPASIKDARKLLKADPWPDYEQVKQALPLDKLK